MRINANAKINLSLDVTGRLPNGYHTVSMIMQEVSLCDYIDIELSPQKGIALSTEGMDLPSDEGNIAYRAADAFFKKTMIASGCSIHIQKNIPSCAGLGGGSADAAAVLKGLNELCSYPLCTDELLSLGLTLGADVPFCIMGGCAHAGGIGEDLTPIKSALGLYAAIIKPPVSISTPAAYRAIDAVCYPHPDTAKCIEAVKNGDIASLAKHTANAFEYVCRGMYSEIDILKNHFLQNGALMAMMSGSGSAVFGLFCDIKKAESAYLSYPYPADGGGICKFII